DECRGVFQLVANQRQVLVKHLVLHRSLQESQQRVDAIEQAGKVRAQVETGHNAAEINVLRRNGERVEGAVELVCVRIMVSDCEAQHIRVSARTNVKRHRVSREIQGQIRVDSGIQLDLRIARADRAKRIAIAGNRLEPKRE